MMAVYQLLAIVLSFVLCMHLCKSTQSLSLKGSVAGFFICTFQCKMHDSGKKRVTERECEL